MTAGEIKEVQMDEPFQEGGRKRKPRSKTRKRKAESEAIVTKAGPAPAPAGPTVSAPAPTPAPAPAPAKIVIAPPKKKPAKVMLVSTTTKAKPSFLRKTFKAKQIKVTIDNTAKTRKHRTSVLQKVDAMTDEQIRAAAVHARLSRPDSVGKVPIALLRQMVKDYQTMRRMLL
jgi:hypothetical protein